MSERLLMTVLQDELEATRAELEELKLKFADLHSQNESVRRELDIQFSGRFRPPLIASDRPLWSMSVSALVNLFVSFCLYENSVLKQSYEGLVGKFRKLQAFDRALKERLIEYESKGFTT